VTFNLDVLADEEARTPWEFVLGGKTWRVPHVADLTLRQQLDADRGRPDLAVTEALVQDGDEWKPAGAECAAAIQGLKGKRRGVWFAAWLAHAGMEPGESGASPS
jgi:hypothetical protein